MLKPKRVIYALPGWAVNASIFNLLNTDELTCIGINYYHISAPSLQDIADKIARQLPKHCILLGWSLGGLIATDIAARYPEKISHLILVASQPKFIMDSAWHGIDYIHAKRFMNQWLTDPAQQIQDWVRLMCWPARAPTFRPILRQHLLQQPHKELRTQLRLLFQSDHRKQYRAMTTPTLHIVPCLDQVLPQNSAQLKNLNPAVNILTCHRSGHTGLFSTSSLYIKKIRSFLNESEEQQ